MAAGTAAAWLTAIGTVASAGASIWSTAKQMEAQKKARRAQRAALAKAAQEAKDERDRIANLDQDRLDRLKRRGAQLPASLLTGGMSGATGGATTRRPILG